MEVTILSSSEWSFSQLRDCVILVNLQDLYINDKIFYRA